MASPHPWPRLMANLCNAVLVSIALFLAAALQPVRDPEPLDLARMLVARYPVEVSIRYIPALIWSGALRLTHLTGESRWSDKARREMEPFVSGRTPSIAPPHVLTSLAGHLALSDFGADADDPRATALARQAADFILPESQDEVVRFARGWTDDMFMATSLLARVAARTGEDRYAQVVARLLTTYAGKLQRSDGLFIHALEGPHAWGRGNGFAALGLADALTYLPDTSNHRTRVLDIYRRHVHALVQHQAEDGAWRQIVDDPAAYRELTVTAMTVAAIARGVRHGWLNASAVPAMERGWRAVAMRVSADGTLRDVCPSTGAGPTKEHYLSRPPINGPDDRGAAMALLAALEVEELRRMSK